MAVPRISALLMLRSTISTVSAPATCPFRGSITYPTQLLRTLRGRRYRRLTQHLLPGGPLRPYPDRSCTGWTAPAFVGAFGYMGWPNDPDARVKSIAVVRGWTQGSRVIPRRLRQIQTDWVRVGDKFSLTST